MKIAHFLAAIAVVMLISGTAFAGQGDNNSIQSRHGGENGGGNSWGQGTSAAAKSEPGAIPNAHGRGKP